MEKERKKKKKKEKEKMKNKKKSKLKRIIEEKIEKETNAEVLKQSGLKCRPSHA
jgi:hypothetical protein